jgi:hypothetical protein
MRRHASGHLLPDADGGIDVPAVGIHACRPADQEALHGVEQGIELPAVADTENGTGVAVAGQGGGEDVLRPEPGADGGEGGRHPLEQRLVRECPQRIGDVEIAAQVSHVAPAVVVGGVEMRVFDEGVEGAPWSATLVQ